MQFVVYVAFGDISRHRAAKTEVSLKLVPSQIEVFKPSNHYRSEIMLHDVVEILSRNAVNGSRCTVIGFGWRHQVPMCMRFTIVQIGEYSGANLRVGVRPRDHLCCEKNTDSRRASIIYEIKVQENLLSRLDVWLVSL